MRVAREGSEAARIFIRRKSERADLNARVRSVAKKEVTLTLTGDNISPIAEEQGECEKVNFLSLSLSLC